MPSCDRTMSTRKLVFLSLMIALSMGLHVVESAMPLVMPMPGIKLGLANLVTVICLFIFGAKDAMLVLSLRLILVGIVAGSFLTPSFWISCGGGLTSMGLMALGKGMGGFTPVGISVLGALAHNMGQLAVVMWLMNSKAVMYYLPWLLLWAIPMGLITGFSAQAAIKALRNINLNGTMK
jgi:heptaprenyl diphosphate synthase